jgi:hypothetical protein
MRQHDNEEVVRGTVWLHILVCFQAGFLETLRERACDNLGENDCECSLGIIGQ